MVAIINYSPVPHAGYRFGAHEGEYTELLRTEIYKWGKTGTKYSTEKVASHGKEDSLSIDIPPMGGILLYCPNKKKVAKSAELDDKKPVEKKPAAKVEKKPTAKKPAAKTEKPAAKKSAAAAKKPVAEKKPTVKKTATKKTAAAKAK